MDQQALQDLDSQNSETEGLFPELSDPRPAAGPTWSGPTVPDSVNQTRTLSSNRNWRHEAGGHLGPVRTTTRSPQEVLTEPDTFQVFGGLFRPQQGICWVMLSRLVCLNCQTVSFTAWSVELWWNTEDPRGSKTCRTTSDCSFGHFDNLRFNLD